MSGNSGCGNSSAQTPSKMSLQSSQTMSLAKTLHVQDQIIEQLRADQASLREALEAERNALRDCRISSDRELKTLQRENLQITKVAKQQEVKIDDLEKSLTFAKEALANEQKNLKSLEKEHFNTVKELKMKNSKENEKSNKQEMIIDQLRSEIEDLKEALESERNATSLLIREHNAEVKMLREEVRAKSTEAYRELKERAIRERDEYREMQEEAEKTYKVLEKDFRDALAAKDEEIKKLKTESRLIQKELEDQLRASLREPTPHLSSSSLGHHDYLSNEKTRKLKNEISILKEQNRKLLNELELLVEEEKMNEIKKEHYFLPFSFQLEAGDSRVSNETVKIDNQMEVLFNADKESRTEINRLLGEIRSKNRTIHNLQRELSTSKQTLEKVCRLHEEDTERIKRRFCEASGKRVKPKLPMKLVKPTGENAENRRTYVRDIVRRLQERHKTEDNVSRFVIKSRKAETEDSGNSNQTLEDLKAIDEDIEKLRKQIEERDKIISALREAAEAKDKKLDELMTDYSKLQMERAEPECRTSLNGDTRVQERNLTAFSTSPSPPLCNGELCWTDGFVNKNYHEPVYAQLLNDHTALQKIYNELREKLESKTKELEEDENFPKKPETYENGINLIMAEQIRILKEREAQLMSEAEELREQNDLMEFRILELEECRKEEMINEHKHKNEKNIWSERDLEEVSDSGVMSLPTSEDLTSDSELGDTIKNYLQTENGVVSTLFPQVQISCSDTPSNDFKQKKILRNTECLQESGIFEDSEVTEGNSLLESTTKHTKACQTESILDKTLLDIIDSSCDLILSKNKNYLADKQRAQKSDDLTTEISKLSEIQKRIQEKRENVCESPKTGFQQLPSPCTHSNSTLFYEERLKQLEDKLKIYESSGDTKDALLKKRLEKEVELSHRVKELTERVISLEFINKQIEEEKCEFEEAENDSRFQCQRLEVKVQELMDKNSELELELERQKMMMAGDRVDGNKRKNAKTKEKINTDNGLSMIEAAMPGIIAWNMFCLNQAKDEISEHLQSEAMLLDENDPTEYCKSIAYPDGEVFKKLEELINDQKKLRIEYERAEEEGKKREESLKRKIEELEGKSARDRETIEEMTLYLKSLKEDKIISRNTSSDSVPFGSDFEMFEELKHLAENEKKMRRQIDTLERKEQAYLQTLQQADEIWAGMEEEYKKKLSEAEEYGSKLRERVVELEEALGSKELTRRVDTLTLENEELKGKVKNLADAELESRVKALENENSSLKNVIRSLREELPLAKKKSESLAMELEVRREQYIQDKLTIEQLGRDLEEKKKSLEKVETGLLSQISVLTQELAAKSKELSNLDVTVAELREEVETLENKVTELMGVLQNSRLSSQEDSSSSVHGMTDPRRFTSLRSMSSLCEVMPDIPVTEVIRVECRDEFPVEESIDGSDTLDGLAKLEVPATIANRLGCDSDRLPPREATLSLSEVMNETMLSSREVICIIEKIPPITVFLSPAPETVTEIHLLALNPSPEIAFLAPESQTYPKERVLIGYSSRCVTVDEIFLVERSETSQIDRSENEIDISELKLNNTILQNALEKMEEETRLKDLELTELKQTVSDIRREQQELELKLTEQTFMNPVESKATEIDFSLVCGSTGQDDSDDDDKFEDLESENSFGYSDDRTTESVGDKPEKTEFLSEIPMNKPGHDILHIFSGTLIKPPQRIIPSMSNLQVALDNLQNKCRIKNAIFQALLEEFKEKLDPRRCEEDKLKQIIPNFKAKGNLYQIEKLKDWSESQLKIIESNRKNYPCNYPNTPADFSFSTPITVTRKIGSDGLFVEWDTEGKPSCVIGYEICVNGNLHHRVRSATRNKALLSNLDFTKRNLISVYPVSVKGRSATCTSVTFPEEVPANWN